MRPKFELPPNYISQQALGLKSFKKLLSIVLESSCIPFIVTVSGTNGKGSVAAACAAIWKSSGYKVATFTSPHLFFFNERLAINSQNITDSELELCWQELVVVLNKNNLRLCYFEHSLLLACIWFKRHGCDIWILEAGIGGKHDAVNAFDANLLITTQVAKDHCELLGSSLEQIAEQKLGLLRADSRWVCAESKQLSAITNALAKHSDLCWHVKRDFDYQLTADGFKCKFPGLEYDFAAEHNLLPANITTAIAACHIVADIFPLLPQAVPSAVATAQMPGRQQNLYLFERNWCIDVAHNPAACRELSRALQSRGCSSVVGILGFARSKAAFDCVQELLPVLRSAYSWPIDDGYMMSSQRLSAEIGALLHICIQPDIASTIAAVIADSRPGDTIAVFGSFRVVAAVLQSLGALSGQQLVI